MIVNIHHIPPHMLCKTVREHANMTQKQFSELIGVSHRTIAEWEQCRRKPCMAAITLIKLAYVRPDVLLKS